MSICFEVFLYIFIEIFPISKNLIFIFEYLSSYFVGAYDNNKLINKKLHVDVGSREVVNMQFLLWSNVRLSRYNVC